MNSQLIIARKLANVEELSEVEQQIDQVFLLIAFIPFILFIPVK